jgi:putative tryptophan/tyrosine transport system substrate-binding protein
MHWPSFSLGGEGRLMSDMRRREFIALLGGAAAWPLAARAQQPAMPVIGSLNAGSLNGYANHAVAFRQGLNEAGFVAGQSVAIEYRWADGQYDRLPALASDLVGRQVAVLFAGGGQLSVRAARAATATIPIVFTSGADPVEAGLVASLHRPEGNVTGVSFSGRALGPKRIELIRELLHKATTIAVLHNPQNPLRPAELADLQTAAGALGQQLRILSAGTTDEIDQVFAQLDQQRPDALVLNGDLLFTSERKRIVALAARHAIPTIYHEHAFAREGGLISYGASTTAAYRQAGIYVGRILKGSKPADLPVMLPTTFDLVINLKTAKALGLKVPESFVLYRADEVIE